MARLAVRESHESVQLPLRRMAEVLTVAPANGDQDLTLPGDCYVVRFPDGVTDFWPVYDDDAGYEYSSGGTLNERSEG